MATFTYPPEQRKRGTSIVVLSIVCYLLFSFFLLAGFYGLAFVPYAFGVLTVGIIVMTWYGAATARAGKGTVELTADGILWRYKRQTRTVPFAELSDISFGGGLYKKLNIAGGGQKITLYKTLRDYPAFWRALKSRVQVPALPLTDVSVPLTKTDGMGIALAAAALLLVGGCGVLAAYVSGLTSLGVLLVVLALFVLDLGICATLVISKLGAVTFGQDKIVHKTRFKEQVYETSALTGAIFEQAKVKMLITGYQYRGPAMTNRAVVSNTGLGLRVLLDFNGALRAVDDTMTTFPLELLGDYISARYGVPEQLTAEKEHGNAE